MTEHEIIRGCKQGVTLYQRTLVERYSPMLFTVARRYGRDRHAAEDVLQDALMKIFRAIPKYEPTGSFEAWMRRIVVTTALQALDKSWHQRESGNLDYAEEPVAPPDIYARMGAEELLQLIAKLPDGFRQIFNLHIIEQYPHTEIAVLLGITESTSRSQLTRARCLLQSMIAEREKVKI
ncbi:MAG: RNA polymerase sigma factor [Saprospiraceae bacterium]|nr:RNA polymerase sigma factor [Saprospiraceae bacterium]MDZ4703968.1 RNA polymerase sigma factor [Saprospiraceae bacterium]